MKLTKYCCAAVRYKGYAVYQADMYVNILIAVGIPIRAVAAEKYKRESISNPTTNI